MLNNQTEEPVIDPYFEKMIGKWKRIAKEIKQANMGHIDRKLHNKRRRKEILNNGKIL